VVGWQLTRSRRGIAALGDAVATVLSMSEKARRTVRTYRAALERYDLHRDSLGYRDPVLPVETGVVHAVSGPPLERWEDAEFKVNPWGAACGDPVHVILPVPFVESDPDACAACAKAIAEGRPVKVFQDRPCFHTVSPPMTGYSQVVGCELPDGHRGPHRGEGATWTYGGEDFTPDEYTAGVVVDEEPISPEPRQHGHADRG
jgi:hypothetical protein